ncbi:MAG TPA: RDD family protein, partial [Gemmatimonadaceae bacterium]
ESQPSPPESTARPAVLPPLPQNLFVSGYASRSDRLLGQIIDGVIGALPMIGALAISWFNGTLGGIGLLGGFLWSICYYLFADGLRDGQSFGKRYVGMRVVDARSGMSCTFGQSFVRNVLLAMLGPLDWIFIFGEEHQRLGDKAAGTIVIYD